MTNPDPESEEAVGGPPGPRLARYRLQAEVVESIALPGEHHRLILRAPEIVAVAQPGQFLNIWVHNPADIDTPPVAAVLRRPFSISRTRPPDRLDLLLRVHGTGGRIIARKVRGDVLDIIGPLGHGFEIPEEARLAVIVAGGSGLAPVPLLIETLVARRVRTVVLAGATEDTRAPFAIERAPNQPVTIPELVSLGAEVSYVSQAVEGAVVNKLLEQRLPEFVEAGAYVFAIGPRAMLHNLSMIVGEHGRLQVSLEERMACGVGACRSCVIPMRGPEGPVLRAACKDGPVFWAHEVDWEQLS